MSEYTKGPWKLEGDKVGPRSMEDDQSYGMVMPVAYIEKFDVYNYIANANLIAAAPELLEALELIVDRFMPCRDDYIFSKRAALDKAAAIIAKAKGETK